MIPAPNVGGLYQDQPKQCPGNVIGNRPMAEPVTERPLAQKICDLENRAFNNESAFGKAFEELFARVAELERIVRG